MKQSSDIGRVPLPSALAGLPAAPGVYRFFDADGALLYVGKAKSLRARVRSYFQNPDRLAARTRRLSARAASVAWTRTRTETESLLLEANWIAESRPPYNIMLRSEKNFLYLGITREPFPNVFFTRKRRGGATYLGPFAKPRAVRATVEFLREILAFRMCRVQISAEGKATKNPERRRLPCLDAEIGRCTAPCDQGISMADYAERIGALSEFFRGRSAPALRRAEQEMKKAAGKKLFERAARLRDVLTHLREASEKSAVFSPQSADDADIIGAAFGVASSAFCVFSLRNGALRRRNDFSLPNAETEGDTLENFLREYAEVVDEIPPDLIVPAAMNAERCELFADFLSQKRGGRVAVRAPERGWRREALELASKNAATSAAASRASFEDVDALDALQRSLQLPARPSRIEGYDISHLGGKEPVGSRVVFTDGAPNKAEYRRYNIRSVPGGNDDPRAMGEVLSRRLARLRRSDIALRVEPMPAAFGPEYEAMLKQENLLLAPPSKEQFAVLLPATAEQVGYARSFLVGRCLCLGGVVVAPDFRGRGYGTQLVLEVSRHLLQASGASTLRLFLRPEKRRWAVALAGLGFVEEAKPPAAAAALCAQREQEEGQKMFVMRARMADLRRSEAAPDLLVIDGGKTQLASVAARLAEAGLEGHVPVVSLAKKREEVYLPGRAQPLRLPEDCPELRLLQRVRDEAHRFALGGHRRRTKKSSME